MIEQPEATDGILSVLMHERAKQIGKRYGATPNDSDVKGKLVHAAAARLVAEIERIDWKENSND